MKKFTKKDTYKVVTDKIIELLEKGVVPWKRPWHSLGRPLNMFSQTHYRGFNNLLLSSFGETNYWLTFLQIKKLGGMLKKGSKALPVIFWKPINYLEHKKNSDKNDELCRIPYLIRT